MAIIQFGDIVTGMRGSVGGATYGNSRSGFTKRNKPVPVQPVSQLRGATRVSLAYWQGQWRELSEARRSAWNAATANFPRVNSLGITYYLTGINLFTSFNITLAMGAYSSILDPPSPYSFPAYTVDTLEYDTSGDTMNLTVDPTPSSPLWYIVEGLRYGSPGVTSPRGAWRFLFAFNVVIGPSINIGPVYAAIFGAPIVGSKGFIRITPATDDTGQRGVTTVVPFLAIP